MLSRYLVRALLFMICLFVGLSSMSAQDRVLSHEDLATWNQIEDPAITADGKWVHYSISPNEGDPALGLYHVESGESRFFPRAKDARFSFDSQYLVYLVSAAKDTIKEMKRRHVDEEDLPKDTLVVMNLGSGSTREAYGVKSYKLPTKSSGYIAYTTEQQSATSEDNDTTSTEEAKKPRHSKKNGYLLVVLNLENGSSDSLDYVTSYTIANEGKLVGAISKGQDSVLNAGVFAHTLGADGWQSIKLQEGKYSNLHCDVHGRSVAFTGDIDTTEALVRPYEIFHWPAGSDSAEAVVTPDAGFLPEDWIISGDANLFYSDNGKNLFFGIAPQPILQDTSLLEEEIVNVEVWHYQDKRLYTQQNVLADKERKLSYLSFIDLDRGTSHSIASVALPEYRMDRDKKSQHVLVYTEEPYLQEISWKGYARKDISVYNLQSHGLHQVAQGVIGSAYFSPGNNYIYWYNRGDSLWHMHNLISLATTTSEDVTMPLYDEANDLPTEPYQYGSAGWLSKDEQFIVYDQFDLWLLDPQGVSKPYRLTDGRPDSIRYRLIDLDHTRDDINPEVQQLLHILNLKTKASGYATLDIRDRSVTPVRLEDALYTSRPIKADSADVIVYTRETFGEFPNLQVTSDGFISSVQISNANPQQAEYKWGTSELFKWTAYDGKQLQGVIVKPDDFDPSRKYPLLVNFYERSSENLHKHRTPYPHRSTINYSFYASRDYIIFNPDVIYDIGYPGASAYNCVISGIEAVVDLDFIDRERIGVQGHSWGGYQVADLVTRTDIFACAESGAPLVNMINAYGGIRWQTGLSRMFQYERTQSRLGVTLWEDPDLYVENSPIFNMDKVTTPLLIMHNDKDGHVPWHLGIEFFVAMRRLNKPAWLLVYNDEPHWPLKLRNRKDFNIRMQQFFDHYLMGKPRPKWMRDGVPSIEKGINQGYELIRE